MWLPILSALWRSNSRRPAGPARPKPASARLSVEALEDRSVPATLSISDVSVSQGGVAAFIVTLSEPSDSSVSVVFATRDTGGPAKAERGDYDPRKGTLTFAPGETSKTIYIQTHFDLDMDVDQFFVNLSHASGATILDGQGLGTILESRPPRDPDPWPIL